MCVFRAGVNKFVCCADVFEQGAWNQCQAVNDPELRELAQILPDIVIRGKAPSTVKQYSGAFLRWKAWAAKKSEVRCFPVSPFHFSLYMAYLIQKASSPAPVEQAVCAVSWVHKLALREDPTEHPLVGQMLAGAKRILCKPVAKKQPITPSMLSLLVSRFGGKDAPLSDVRTLAICLVSFAGSCVLTNSLTLKSRMCHITMSTWSCI